MMLLVATVSLLLLLPLKAQSAKAKHRICTWDGPGSGSPGSHGFRKFCSAGMSRVNETHATFGCNYPGILSIIVKVADYGYLAPKTLEFASPCAHDGYARNSEVTLCGTMKAVGVCLGQSVQCKFMSGKDDCSWASTFEPSDLPQSVEIWGREYF